MGNLLGVGIWRAAPELKFAENKYEQLVGRQTDPFYHAFRGQEKFGSGRPVAQVSIL
ncbi:hypothetical protein D3C77_744680 [compost metagenome]